MFPCGFGVSMVLPDVTANCDHDVVKSKTLGKLSVKCAGCGSRKKWPWTKMAKCHRKYNCRHRVFATYRSTSTYINAYMSATDCKKLWHRQCAPSSRVAETSTAVPSDETENNVSVTGLDHERTPSTALPINETGAGPIVPEESQRLIVTELPRAAEGPRYHVAGDKPAVVVAEPSGGDSGRPKDVVRFPSCNVPRAMSGLERAQVRSNAGC